MSTTVPETAFVAEVQTGGLRNAITEACGSLVKVVRQGQVLSAIISPSRPTVYFQEVTTGGMDISERIPRGIFYALVLVDKSGEVPMPFQVSKALFGTTPRRLGRILSREIKRLQETKNQCIAGIERSGKDLLVQFLDGESFRLPIDDEHRWDRVEVSPDRHYLLVPRNDDSRLDTFPWDAIRKPQSHLDEEERTKHRLAETLVSLRAKAGLSQDEAAQKSGLSRKTISRLEHAGNYPGVRTLEALARAYSTTLSELLRMLRS